ncbi:MAG: flagellar basal body P-ring formation chaperone FlgA [Candidatus Hydrogenedentota bacterium]
MCTTAGRYARTIRLLAALLLYAGAAAADTLTLKSEAFVRGPRVLLGEVAEIEGTRAPELASIELGSAALPGDSKRLQAALVEARIRNAGLDLGDVEVHGAHAVRATTLHMEVTRTMLTSALRAYIESEMPWNPEHAEINILASTSSFRVPDGEVRYEWQASPEYNYLGKGVFRGAVLVDGEEERRFTMKADVEAYGPVVVAATDIPRGYPVSQSALTTEMRALSKLGHGAFTDPRQVTGYVARTNIFPGQEITNRKVKPQELIKRNQMVSVEMQAGTLRVQMQAKALGPAAAGDTIVCENPQSEETVQGVVRNDGVVVVR